MFPDTTYRFFLRWVMPSVLACFLVSTVLLHNAVQQSDQSLLPSLRNSVPNVIEDFVFEGRTMHRYANIRQKYDELYPPDDIENLKAFAKQMRKNEYKPIRDPHWNANDSKHSAPFYDIFNCPEHPPVGYPHHWNTVDVLTNWSPNDISPPSHHQIYQGICRFDYATEYHKALNYRNAEVPFVLRDDPKILPAVLRWNQEDYLPTILGNERQKTEYSKNNHLMFFRTRHLDNVPDDWSPPIENIKMTYNEWFEAASVQPPPGKDDEHFYFRFNAAWNYDDPAKGQNPWVYSELPIFKPTKKSFYMVDNKAERGINCRFGMPGNLAETHFDGSRNFILLMGGERRYVLSHPQYCPNMELYPESHPSGRHSKINWGDPNSFTDIFKDGMLNEVILQAGDALYLPNFWFHFIQSVTVNFQCNARSGKGQRDAIYQRKIQQCGFHA